LLTANRLQPGETAKLTIEVNSLTQPDGPNRWQVQVSYTLDLPPAAVGALPVSQSGTQVLAITANLSREVSVTPPQVAFSCTGVAATPYALSVRFAPGQDDVSALVQLRAADGKAVAVASAESDDPAVKLKWSPGSGPVATVRITVAAPMVPAGSCVVRVRLSE